MSSVDRWLHSLQHSIREEYLCFNSSRYSNMPFLHAVRKRIHEGASPLDPSDHTLFYGPSWLRQIAVALVSMGSPLINSTDHRVLQLNKSQGVWSALPAGVPYEASRPRPCGEDCWAQTEVFATARFANGGALTVLCNYSPLMRPSAAEALQRFVAANRGRFSHVFGMQPHPECFYDWAANPTLPQCVRIENGCMCKWKDTLELLSGVAASRKRVTNVLHWDRGRFGSSSGRLCSGSRADKADRAWLGDTIDTSHWVSQHPCMTPDCTPSVHNHQCMPGTPDLIAGHLVQARLRGWEGPGRASLACSGGVKHAPTSHAQSAQARTHNHGASVSRD